MSLLPDPPARGVKIKPWLVKLYYYVRSLSVTGDGKTIFVTRGPLGTTISAIPPAPVMGGGPAAEGSDPVSDVVLCVTTAAGSAEAGYPVALYADGPGKPSTGKGTLLITELAFNSVLPVGSRILGHRVMIQETGGNET